MAEALCERFSARATVPLDVGIRPEHLRFADQPRAKVAVGSGGDRGGVRVALTVEVVEALGHETLVHGTAAGGVATVVRLPQGA